MASAMSLDRDVRKVVNEFIKLGRNEKPADCLKINQNGTYEFTDSWEVNYPERELWVKEDYEILTEGSTAIIIHCYEQWDDYKREYALKVPRPSVLGVGEQGSSLRLNAEELDEQRKEAAKQGRLSHPNVTYLVDSVDVHLPVGPEPRGTIMLQEWIEGAEPLDKYVYDSENNVGLEDLIELFIGVFNGLSHIHEKNLIHWDVKAGNCLVDEDATVKISDVGNACEKAPSGGRYEEETERYTSIKCLPSEDQDREDIDVVKRSDRLRIPIESGDRILDRPWFDLYMAGRMMARVCGLESEVGLNDDDTDAVSDVFDPKDPHTEMTERFLITVIKRLLKPARNGLRESKEPYYRFGTEVANDLEKLLHEFGDATDVTELYPVSQESIRIPVTGGTEFSARIASLADTDPARRLQEHRQLGLARFVYPGARHSRFEHVLGTIGTTLEYVRALYSDRTSPTFRLLCDSRHVRALIFAAAVHDFGHGAFCHYIEEKEALFGECTHHDYIQAVLRDDASLYDAEVSEGPYGHLENDREELEDVAEDWIKNNSPSDDEIGEFLELVANILKPTEIADPEWEEDEDFEPDLTDQRESEQATIWILHSILESAFDADKLDYLRRDAWHAGLDYPEGADVDRFLQSLTVTTASPGENTDGMFRPTIAVNQNGVDSLESLLLARYQVHKSLYWHREVRAAATLLKNQVWRYLNDSAHTDSSFEDHRRELLGEFREIDDESAIRWLLNEREQGDTDEDIDRYLDALVGSDELPKAIIDVGQGKIIEEKEDELKAIIKNHEQLNDLNRDWNDYSRYRAAVLEETGDQLVTDLEENGLEQDIDLGQGTLFIDVPAVSDVPVANMGQIKNLFVADRRLMQPSMSDGDERQSDTSNPLGASHEIQDFEQFSALGEDVKDAIEQWARPIRVFVWEEDRNAILDDVDLENQELAVLVIDALHEAYDRVTRRIGKPGEMEERL